MEAADRWFLVAPIPACSHPELQGVLALVPQPAKISHRKLAMRLKLRRGRAEAADRSLRVEPVPAACSLHWESEALPGPAVSPALQLSTGAHRARHLWVTSEPDLLSLAWTLYQPAAVHRELACRRGRWRPAAALALLLA